MTKETLLMKIIKDICTSCNDIEIIADKINFPYTVSHNK